MVHQYKLFGQNIVVDGATGAVHRVDDLAYDAIAHYLSHQAEDLAGFLQSRHPGATPEEVKQLLDEISALKQEGGLFAPEDPYLPIAQGVKSKGIVKALCLHVAHSCNLACNYCFAAAGTHSGKDALMSFDVGKQALDFLLNHSGDRHFLEVDFFGGEPLLNWQVVKDLVAYGRAQEKHYKKCFRFTLTTNGMGIDEDVIEFSNREMENVVLSLDGRQKVHDRFRKKPDGSGSYAIVVPKFQELVRRRGNKPYYIRGTFTRHNLDFLEDILHIASLGFREISMEPIVGPASDPNSLTEEHLPHIMGEYERLAQYLKEHPDAFSFYHYTLNLDHGPCVHKRLLGCGAGTEYLAVTPRGDLFPCHQFVGDEKFFLGDVWQGTKNTEVVSQLAACNVYQRPDCISCWAKLFCGGGCAANAYHMSGRVEGIDDLGCTYFKKRLECAIWLKMNT